MTIISIISIPIIYHIDNNKDEDIHVSGLIGKMGAGIMKSRFLVATAIAPFSFLLLETSGYQQSDAGVVRAIQCIILCILYISFLRINKTKEL